MKTKKQNIQYLNSYWHSWTTSYKYVLELKKLTLLDEFESCSSMVHLCMYTKTGVHKIKLSVYC